MRPAASKGQWDLSYEACVFGFVPGKGMTFAKEKVRSDLEIFKKTGVRWICIVGINPLEPLVPMGYNLQEVICMAKEWIEELGLKVSSFHYSSPTFAPLNAGQDSAREILVKNVELFKIWEPKSFVVHPVWIMGENSNPGMSQKFDLEVAEHGEKEVLRVIAGNLKIMGKQAAKYGIKLAIENLGKLGGSQKDYAPLFVKMIDEPNVGYCIDSGHAHCSGLAVPNLIRQAGSRLFETHFHDNRGPDYGDEHMPVGFGTISWLDVITALKEVNFPGPVTFETEGWSIPDRAEGYIQAMAWWRACEQKAQAIKSKG